MAEIKLDENEATKEKLKKVYNENRSNLAVLVGAGLSVELDIRNWTDLLKCMRTSFNSGIFGSDQDLEDSIEKIGHPKTASKIYNENHNHEDYLSFMKLYTKPRRAYHYSIHIKILSIFDFVLTTNYDSTFEEALKDLDYYLAKCNCSSVKWEIQKLPDFSPTDCPIDSNSKPHLVYLHGNNKGNDYVFREEEYRDNYPNFFDNTSKPSKLECFLKQNIENFNFLFIGFSFEDMVFLEFFRRTILELQSKQSRESAEGLKITEIPDNFVFFPKKYSDDVQKKERIQVLKELGVNIIKLESYVEIEQILHNIRDFAEIRDIGDAAYGQ